MTQAISGSDMAKIDRVMMDDYGVETLQLMELAGHGIAEVIRQERLVDLAASPSVVCLCGTGGNGGDAMVVARLLHAWGAAPIAVLAKPRDAYTGIALHQLEILDRMGIPVRTTDEVSDLPDAELIVDGLFGFSLQGNPRGDAARLIDLTNAAPAHVLAIDLPSGLDATSGAVVDPCIRADVTVTLALPKTGLLLAPPEITGPIWCADIGVPPSAYRAIGADVDPAMFRQNGILRIR